jgi:hypothetical protein
MIGKRSGRVVVIGRVDRLRVRIRCDCGTEKTIWRANFRRARSCGCLKRMAMLRNGLRTRKKSPAGRRGRNTES